MARKKKTGVRLWLQRLLWMGALLALVGGYFLWRDYAAFANSPLIVQDNEARIKVKRGASFNRIVKQIEERGLARPAERWEWRLLAEEMNVLNRLHAGEYSISHGMTPRDLLGKMARGEVVQYRFTIIEGTRFSELRAALIKDPNLVHTIENLSDEELMGKLGRVGVHPEGRFLPETYSYPSEFTDLELLKLAADAMDKALVDVFSKLPKDSPLKSKEDILTMASIVEKETGKASERPRIAGVFVRRLNMGMKLQTDPTVIYGIGDAYNGNITRKHLETDTPYNTYTRYGLPPTPIALPGRDALEAVVQPTPGEELFFVARGDGSHEFTSNLRDHNAAVNKFQLN